MTTYQFHFPASNESTLTIALPEELRGEPLKIVVEKETAHETGILSIAGILKDGRNDDVRGDRYEYLECRSKPHISKFH